MIYSGPIDHVCHLNLQNRKSVDDLMLVTLSLPYLNFSLAKFMSFMTVHDESTMLWSCQVDQYCCFVVHYLTWSHLHFYIHVFCEPFCKAANYMRA